MPELPEVEDAARRLRAAITGRRIVRLRVSHAGLARRLPPATLESLAGRRVERVERRGKHQLIRLDDGRALHVHFRMNGDWHMGRVADPEPPHLRAALELDDGSRVALVDSRALATITVVASGEDPLALLGPEPADPALDASSLGRALARRRGPIKPALLDQQVIAGIGNIYAAESLWRARISPRAAAASLSTARRVRLIESIRAVLHAPPAGRYTASPAAARWKVYDREGEPCPRCGAAIRRIVQAGRSTFYCPRCQAR